jgi:hypothetical protein
MQPNLPQRFYSASMVAQIAGMLPHCMASPTTDACLLEHQYVPVAPQKVVSHSQGPKAAYALCAEQQGQPQAVSEFCWLQLHGANIN